MQSPFLKFGPYYKFKDDRQLRLALLSRDIRIAVVAIAGMVTASPHWHMMLVWLKLAPL